MHSSPGVDADVTDGINADDLADGLGGTTKGHVLTLHLLK